MTGRVKDILIAKTTGSALYSKPSVQIHSGKGIVGDRYYSQTSVSSSPEKEADFEITLIEQEQIDSFNQKTGFSYSAADFRRNVVTSGINLNALEGETFSIGTLKLKGVRLCEPCAYLAKLLGPEIMEHMVHKAGLRARILDSGVISVGDNLS